VLSIGPYKIRNRVILAPMAGLTDSPFRALAWKYGVGHVVSEMISAREDLWETQKSRQRRAADPEVFPRAIQIAGGDPESIRHSAQRCAAIGADIVDLNFGCPAKKVCRKFVGSYLLKNPVLVESIARSAVAAIDLPVTAKIRTGWSKNSRNGVEIALRLQDAGISALAVHGRTRECRFVGEVEYDTISEIKEAIEIPVFANGDIDSLHQAQYVFRKTQCDGVMIGRGALGQPWFLGDLARGKVVERGVVERLGILMEHVISIQQFYGIRGVRIARKHVSWYFERFVSDFEHGTIKKLSVWQRRMKVFNSLNSPGQQIGYLQYLSLRTKDSKFQDNILRQ